MGGHPRVLTNAVSGEGDLSGTAGETLPTVRMHRELWGDRKPLWIYNACSYHFPSWGSLADIRKMGTHPIFLGTWDREQQKMGCVPILCYMSPGSRQSARSCDLTTPILPWPLPSSVS